MRCSFSHAPGWAGGVLVAALACLGRAPADAQITVSGGLESLRWTEDTRPRRVEENGSVATLGVGWDQRETEAFGLAYRSRYYLGWVDYRGRFLFADDREATGTSRYLGTSQEGRLRCRIVPTLDAYGGLGAELWRRTLAGGGREDFDVRYARLGIATRDPARAGWSLEGGAKFVLGVREDAHLTALGFDRNPRLEPRGIASAFALLGYHLRQGWALHAYLDGYRLAQSRGVRVTRGGEPAGTVYQPGSDLRMLGVRLTREL